MKRLTDAKKEYRSNILRRLQEFENIGRTPGQIVEKLGDDKQRLNDFSAKKHKIRLINPQDNPSQFVFVVDGEALRINDFAKAIKADHKTVKTWVRDGLLEQRLMERGIV